MNVVAFCFSHVVVVVVVVPTENEVVEYLSCGSYHKKKLFARLDIKGNCSRTK